MNTKITTSVKLDKKIKDEASMLAHELGLSLSGVVNASLRQFVREGRIVFSALPKLNTKKQREFLAMRRDVIAGKNIVGPFCSVDDLKTSLLG